MKTLIGIIAVALLALPAFAQEPVQQPQGLAASSAALAVDVNGNWSAGTLVTESFDVVDFGAKKANHVYLQGNQLVAPTPGFTLYTGGFKYAPDLSGLFSHTNLPVSRVSAFVDGSVGSGTSAKDARVSWLAGGGISYNFTSSLTWRTLQVQYGAIGSQKLLGISTGLQFIFGK